MGAPADAHPCLRLSSLYLPQPLSLVLVPLTPLDCPAVPDLCLPPLFVPDLFHCLSQIPCLLDSSPGFAPPPPAPPGPCTVS